MNDTEIARMAVERTLDLEAVMRLVVSVLETVRHPGIAVHQAVRLLTESLEAGILQPAEILDANITHDGFAGE